MTLIALLQIAGLALISFLTAAAVLWALTWFDKRNRRRAPGFMAEVDHSVVFMFEDENLVNATEEAHRILSAAPTGPSDWERFLTLFQPRFPPLADLASDLSDLGRFRVSDEESATELEAEWRNGLARISLLDADEAAGRIDIDRHSLNALERELQTLRNIGEAAPFLVWRQAGDGRISWANRAYLELTSDDSDAGGSWPPRDVFTAATLAASSDAGPAYRISTQRPGEVELRWFDCIRRPMGNETLFMATAADRAVGAETALREFVQTLTKTFAHLSVGLAIFDKQRRLTLFNPALGDLTGLSPSFMTGRPTLFNVLDQLREKRMIPEQRDYRSWRDRMTDLEAAAVDGSYEETWSLASGQTYRVTGRPHPGGALAFLIEDISAEISLTRRFRAEMETGQAVIDSLPEAIAVFSANGSLALSNDAYARLWGADPSTFIGTFGIVEATRSWSEKCAPSPVWGDVRDYAGSFSDRAEWNATVNMRDGRSLSCRFAPLSGGATLVGFSPAEGSGSEALPVSKARETAPSRAATA